MMKMDTELAKQSQLIQKNKFHSNLIKERFALWEQ